ncbi:MAG: peptidase T [Planctomycetia bacterium]|nr:peptidase T [Planctomycetia bacterium]
MERLLQRFCRYARIDSQADDQSSTYPSTPGQREVGRLLVRELLEMGITDAHQDENGIVMATVSGNIPAAPTIAWVAHVDTSPETSGKGVNPQILRNYDGTDIVLPADPSKVIRVADNPDLAKLKGCTIITTDGTTLLGGDDKAGVAAIMEAAHRLMLDPSLPRGNVRLCFTCDEEIGHGVDHVDLAKLGARVAYTLDGSGTGEIDTETFSADLAIVTIHGTNIHPAIAKGRMVNAVRLAGLFLDRLPRLSQTPELTEGRDGFLHPYVIEGGVAKTSIKILLRDFDTPKLAERAELLRTIGRTVEAEYPTSRVEVSVTPQYRNMADGLKREPQAIAHAALAMKRAGIEPRLTIVRGGTDGSRLTERGLPTPNLSTGEHNFHSPLEWTCLEEMDAAVRVLIELAAVWSAELT